MVVVMPRWERLGTGLLSILATSQGGRPPQVVLRSPVLGIGTMLEHQASSS